MKNNATEAEAKLKFRKAYPDCNIDLDQLTMILSASETALVAYKKRKPSMGEIIKFSNVVVQCLCKDVVCPSIY